MFRRLPPALFGHLMKVILHYPPKKLRRLPPALFCVLMIVILHSPHKKFSASIIWQSNDCNCILSPQKIIFRRLPPALFGHLMIAILHYPPKKLRRLPPALFSDLMIVILHSPHKKISPAAAGMNWRSNDCNFTLSPQKITPAATGII